MRVFLINSVCAFGSTGRIMAELSRMLHARGDAALLAFGRGEAYPDIPTLRIGTSLDCYAHVLNTRLTGVTGKGSKRATEQLIERIRAYSPDLIHLGNIHGYYINLERLIRFLKEYGKPVVWTLHDCWAFTGHCPHFTDVECDRWKTGCYDCPKRKLYPASWFFDRSKSTYFWKKQLFSGFEQLHFVAPSRWLKGCLQESFLQDYPVSVIENGINLSVFRPTPSDFKKRHGLEGKRIVLGVATPWDERKGLFDFIHLRKFLPDDWKIVMVALSEKQMQGLPEGILGLPRTESAQALAEIYSAADVYANPTYCDTFPTTNLEALACGTPVVTYKAGGSPEAVTEQTGFVVPMGDVRALAEAIQKAAETVQREDCAARGREFAREERFGAYLSLYDSLCGGK